MNHAKGAMAATLADVCVVISIALQWGVPIADMGKSLGTIPAQLWVDGAMVETTSPASPVGTIIEAIRKAAE